jgi:hypothetical protein
MKSIWGLGSILGNNQETETVRHSLLSNGFVNSSNGRNIFFAVYAKILIIGFCILLRVILTVNNTFFFATIDKVF